MDLRKWFKRVIQGYIEIDCPKCKVTRWFKWEKDWIYHPEEPPMFAHWLCCKCGWKSPIEPTKLTEDVIRKKFGMSVEEFTKKYLRTPTYGE